jgi:hypothetical protein
LPLMNPPMEFMSPSEESAQLSALIGKISAEVERTIRAGELADVRGEDLQSLMSGAVRLYAARVEEAEPGVETAPVIDETVSTTEAMVVACALLRAHHLNPFDLALWFSRTAPARSRELEP